MRRKHKRPSVPNALRIPSPPKKEVVVAAAPIKLKSIEWQGIERLIEKGAALDDFQRKYMASRAAFDKDKAEAFADLEKQYELPNGAIDRGEWSIIDGHLVCQKAEETQEVKTGTEG